MLLSTCSTAVMANDSTDYYSHEQLIEAYLSTFDEMDVDATFVKELYDIKGNLSFALFTTSNNGYAVLGIDNLAISEISEGDIYSMYDIDNVQYYIGPRGFMSSDEYNEFIVSAYDDEATDNLFNSLSESTDEILNSVNPFIDTNKRSVIIDKPISGTEVGIRAISSVIKSFTSEYWKNTEDNFGDLVPVFMGVCGSIASAMMLTYYDNAAEDLFDCPYAYTNNKYPYWIVSQLVPLIEGLFPGTSPIEIKNGISTFLKNNSQTSLRLDRTYYTDDVLPILKNKKPVVTYVETVYQNPYGLHYVLSFGYVKNADELWFHVADNWGNLAWVNKSWAKEFVYLY